MAKLSPNVTSLGGRNVTGTGIYRTKTGKYKMAGEKGPGFKTEARLEKSLARRKASGGIGNALVKKFVSLVFILTSFGFSQSQAQIDSIHQVLAQLPNNAQLSVAIIDGEQVSYYGAKKEDGSIRTIQNNNNVYEIGSITKVMTSLLTSQSSTFASWVTTRGADGVAMTTAPK